MAGDGVQATDLKRVGKAVPKVYVHKDGKTIMIPAAVSYTHLTLPTT